MSKSKDAAPPAYVQTKMGPGTVVETRNDFVQVVELDWKLANGAKVFVYTKDELPPAKTKLSFKDYMSVLWPAYLCGFVDFLGLAIAIPILPYYALELSWNGEVCPTCPNSDNGELVCGQVSGCGTAIDVGALAGCFSMGQLVGNVVMGRVSDKIGRKFVILLSLAMSAVGYLLCGLATGLPELYAFRCISGLAGGTMPVIISIILDTVQDAGERSKFFGLAGASIGMAFMLGPGIGAGVAAAAGKRAGFFAPVFIAGTTLVAAFYKIVETHPTAGILGKRPKWFDEKFGAAIKAELTEAEKKAAAAVPMPTSTYWACLGMILSSMAFGSFQVMCALVFLYLLNWGSTEVGIYLFVFGMINIFWAVKTKPILEKFAVPGIKGLEYIRAILFSGALMATFLATFSFIQNSVAQYLFMAMILPLSAALKQPCYSQIIGTIVPVHHRGKANGLLQGGQSIGMGLVPFISGALFLSSTFRVEYTYGSFSHLIFFISVFLCGLEACVAWFLLRPAVLKAGEEKDHTTAKVVELVDIKAGTV